MAALFLLTFLPLSPCDCSNLGLSDPFDLFNFSNLNPETRNPELNIRNPKLETELGLVRLKERDVEMIGTMALTAP